MKKILFLISLISLTGIANAQSSGSWTELNPPDKPSGRNAGMMARISDTEILLFGGNDGLDDGETWIFNNTSGSWTQVHPPSQPSARGQGMMARISDTEVLLFGGHDVFNDDETWIFNNTSGSWTQVHPPSQPGARNSSMMAQISDTEVLLFGGSSGGDETWIFNNTSGSWTQVHPPSQPSAREQGMMARISDTEVLLFGGSSGGDETWIFNNTSGSWTQLATPSQPSARQLGMIAQISDTEVLLFGGFDGSDDDETWIFNNTSGSWTQLTTASQPSARNSGMMAQISNNEVLLFGGNDDGNNNDETWVFGLVSETAPAIYNLTADAASPTSATFYLDLADGGATTTFTFDYGTATNDYSFSFTDEVEGNSTTVNVGFEDDSNLAANTQYFVRASATNSVSWTESEEISFWTLTDEPTTQPEFGQVGEANTTISLTFSALDDIVADGYVLIRSGGLIGSDDLPNDSQTYTEDATIGDATVIEVITDGSATSTTLTNLSTEKSWQFALIPYKEGADPSTINYLTDEPATIQGFTIPTLGEYGLITFTLLMGIGGVWYTRKRA